MTRKIKFRAWDKQQKKMLSWKQIDNLDKDGILGVFDLFKNGWNGHAILMQSTELKDTQGKEIYEGDIIEGVYVGLSKSHKPSGHTYQVIWLSGSFDINDPMCCQHCKEGTACSGSLYEFLASCESVKVIGNIYQNKELLIQEKK